MKRDGGGRGMQRTEPRYSALRLRRPRRRTPETLTPRSVEVPVPLWASAAGLSVGVVFCGLAASSGSPFETVALLAGAAAAGGLGVYGFLERLARRNDATEWAQSGEARALIDAVADPMAAIDRFGRVVAVNAAARKLSGGRAPARATDLLHGASAADEIVYRLLGAALSGRPAEKMIETRSGAEAAITVWPIGGGLALASQSPAPGAVEALRPERPRAEASIGAAAPARMGGPAAEAAEIGWFRVDATGRLIEYDRIFARWLGARADAGPLSLRTVLPETVLAAAGGHATRSRLIGAPGAPREVAVLTAPLGHNGETVGVAAAAGTRRPSTDAIEAGDDSVGIFESAPYGVLVLDGDGRIEAANLAAERMFAALGGESPATGANGDHLLDWIDEKDAERVRRAFSAALRGGRGADATLIAAWASTDPSVGPNGQPPRDVEIAFRPYAARGGAPSVVAFLQDASERRGLERNVAQAQKMQAIGVLAGGVAHDFNNMLAVIVGGCDMLIARKTADDPDAQELQMILQSAQRAATLVRQLLAYSRKQHLEPTVADLTEVVSDISMMLNRALSDKWFLQRDLAEKLWPVLVDVNHLGHVITNLVVNAKDAMPKGGKIVVRTSNAAFETPQYGPSFTMPPGQYVRLDVIDEGEGIPPEIQARIFEPFFTTKKIGKGTGLGLSMAYGVVKQSQGYFFVESAPGRGAMFSIFLPRCADETVRAHEEAQRAAAERARVAAAAPGKRVILLVEDESSVRNMAATALRERGYEVIEAADGGEALEVLEDAAREIDLMLSDVVMPDMDGPSVLKALGSRRPEMRTVFMTGYARDNFAETLDDAFAERREFGVLQKPFRLPDLYRAVAEALGAE